MTKQKIQAFFSMFIPFGLSVSFLKVFFKEPDAAASAFLAAGMAGAFVCAVFSKARKYVLPVLLKAQPLAAVVFASSFILSFLPYKIWSCQLFSILLLNALCICQAFENKKSFHNKSSFPATVVIAALTGAAAGGFVPLRSVYVCFVLASLLCRPAREERTLQDAWKDVAFPAFVLVCSFLSFLMAGHLNFPIVLAEFAVMVMTGALLISSKESGVRLMLMTLVMIMFGSYVFSAQNTASVFNKAERSVEKTL